MKILHTADWHLGQLFHEFDRSFEHEQFLNWLLETISQEEIEVLLVSGDVFDISNPAAASIRMFYSFLQKATATNPQLQIVITAGNHDSASRLEAPKPLLESSKIHIVGTVEKNADGSINYEKLSIPLRNKSGEIQTWCLAIPFLRMGDYPMVDKAENPYVEGVAALYQNAFAFANSKKTAQQTIIAMGHLHTQQAQRIGGTEHIRYSGSPLPMSFSERHYKHQVVIFQLQDEISNLKTVEIPVTLPLLQIPVKPAPLEEVLAELHQLKEKDNDEPAPYLEVQVLLAEPEPGLRHKIETALVGKNIKLARIQPHYPKKNARSSDTISKELLTELQPVDVFIRSYQSKYNSEVPAHLMALFQQTLNEVVSYEL
jgi:exonuclease SbcD